jgi:hypothetical protein
VKCAQTDAKVGAGFLGCHQFALGVCHVGLPVRMVAETGF